MKKSLKLLHSSQFDVLLPIRNAENTIDRAIVSILSSNYEKINIFCLDDASNDATPEKLKRWAEKDSRIKILRNERAAGFWNVIRQLLSLVESQFFLFMRPEDELLPSGLALIKQAFESHDADSVYHVPCLHSALGDIRQQACQYGNDDKVAETLAEKSYFFKNSCLWNKIYRTSFFFKKIDNNDLVSHEGLLNDQTIFQARKIVEIPEPVYRQEVDRFGIFELDHFISRDESDSKQTPEYCDEHFLKRFVGRIEKSPVWIEENGLKHKKAFFYGVLCELIRYHQMFISASTKQERPEFSKVFNFRVFTEIARRMNGEMTRYYRTAILPPQYRTFIENNFGLAPEQTGEVLSTPISLNPFQGKIKLSAKSPEVYFENEFLTILSWNVGRGYLAIDTLGYGDPIFVPETKTKNGDVFLSAHSPSSVRVRFKKTAILSGMMNGTADFSPDAPCQFFISERYLGGLTGPLDQTDEVVLEPGLYDLEICSHVTEGRHSLWRIRECTESASTLLPFIDNDDKQEKKLLHDVPLELDRDCRPDEIYPSCCLIDIHKQDIGASLLAHLTSITHRSKPIDWFSSLQQNENIECPNKTKIARCFEEFHKKHLNLTPACRTPDELHDLINEFKSVYLFGKIGDDEELLDIWLAVMRSLPNEKIALGYHLRLIESSKESVNEHNRSLLERLEGTTVCDPESSRFAESMGIPTTELAIHPLFFFEKEKWIHLIDDPETTDSPYILVYLEQDCPELIEFAKSIKDFMNYEVVIFPSIRVSAGFLDSCKGDMDRIVFGGPAEYLSLMHRAGFVLTDNYFGTIFSMIFRKPFNVFIHADEPKASQASLRRLLFEFDMEDRLLNVSDSVSRYMDLEMSFSTFDRKRRTLIKQWDAIMCEKSRPRIVFNRYSNNVASPMVSAPKYPKPDFSVGIGVYNMERFIDDTIGSVLRSTYENFKIVLSDNCSTDGTIPKLKEWAKRDSRIHLMLNDENTGPGGNATRIAPYMNTKHRLWLDADDMLSPYYMEIVKRETERSDPDGIFFQVVFIDENGKYMQGKTAFSEKTVSASHPAEKSLFFCRPANSDKIWDPYGNSVSALNKKRMTNDPNIVGHADVVSHLKMMVYAKNIVSIPNALYYRRIHSSSITERKDAPHQLDAVAVYRNVKEDIVRWEDWPVYKDMFLRYKMNHLAWLYGHVTEDSRAPLIEGVLADMDQDERRFFRNEKFRFDQRLFIDQILMLRGTCSDNNYPQPVAYTPEVPPISHTISDDAYFENDLMKIHGWTVGQGRLGINELGHGNSLSLPKDIKLLTHTILGARCPSKIKITFKRPVGVVGFMNGTTPWSGNSNCLFSVSGKELGCLYGPNDPTPEMIFEPGLYELEIRGLEPEWKHSCWAVRECSNSRTSNTGIRQKKKISK